ncbi:MAG: HAMP domain-containing sensor histidine kinase [Acetobacteraceae bacterium]|nr:HAMP domain-containing sensor histidine kinase [Acetobacteraceae bacterium]
MDAGEHWDEPEGELLLQRPARRAPKGLPTRWVKLLVPAIYLACLVAFISDVTHDNTLAYGIAYVSLVCTAVFHRSPGSVWWLAGIAILMVLIGYFFPAVSSDVVDSIGNRLLSVVAILVVAALVRHARDIQERLAEQTARAEAGERLKTEVFNNLSHEIRTPLHAIIGFSELMMATCRPDQRLPLGQMQVGGKRLLGTIDNLIDLTNLDRRLLRAEPVDIAASMRQAADKARATAAERQVSLVVEIADAAVLPAVADPWAVQRILENLLSNAINFTRTGGTVLVAAVASANGVVATVEDTGIGMSSEMVQELSEPVSDSELAATVGTGLTLSRRLAEAMQAELSFDSRPGQGTTARLRMPAGGAPQASR